MNRYNLPLGPEGEYEPGSRGKVLRNRMDIKSLSLMHNIEDVALDCIENSYFESDAITSETCITAEMICTMHRHWLGEIYDWAGKYRTVDMSKGNFSFPPAYLVSQNMSALERDVLSKHTPCRGKAIEDVSTSLAMVHAELLLVHPFREGNGRIARWLADIMAAQAGLPLPAYGFTGKGSKVNRERYLKSVIAGYAQNYEALSCFFAEALERRLSEL